jgi:hypothetical protein
VRAVCCDQTSGKEEARVIRELLLARSTCRAQRMLDVCEPLNRDLQAV